MSDGLEARIRQAIRAAGPLPLSDYWAMCLFDPALGYYSVREPFGARGDFITAPEVSQMFGEIVGAWLVHAWRVLGCPAPFALVEMGPGRGTLMRDILRTAAVDPAFADAATIHLVETSPRLRDIQRETLAASSSRCAWHDDLSTLPAMPWLFVANELLDAIPVRQFEKTSQGWRERRVGLGEDGELTFVPGPPPGDLSVLPADAGDAPDGAVFEYAPAREAVASELGARLADHGGAALLFDYGHARTGFADTLQALRGHRHVSVFEQPGRCDLTSHVDFEATAHAARAGGANALPLVTQGDFLLALGLLERAGALGHGKDEATQAGIEAAARRLAGSDDGEMGSLFKVLCLTGTEIALPPFV